MIKNNSHQPVHVLPVGVSLSKAKAIMDGVLNTRFPGLKVTEVKFNGYFISCDKHLDLVRHGEELEVECTEL